MEWIRAKLILADDTFNEVEVNFPQLRGPWQNSGRAVMPVIQEIQYELNPSVLDAIGDKQELHIATKTKSTIGHLDDSDIIDRVGVTSNGTFAQGAMAYDMDKQKTSYPKTVYPYDSLFFGALSAKACTVYARIGYCMRNVNQTELMRSLVPR